MEEKLPEGWVWTTLEGVAEIRDDMRVPVNAEERLHRLGPYPYYGATGQVGWIDDYLMDGEYVLLGEDGAPFLDPIQPKAYLISGKSWVNNHAHVLHVLEGMGSNRYLLYALNIFDYRGVVNGTTRLKLTQAAMRQILIPLAPFNEQNCIVSTIEQQFTRLDSAVASLKSAKARIKQYRASLLKSAVEGELTREWRAEHSASETGEQLLARILQERRARWEEEQLRKMSEKGIVPKDEKWKERYEEPQRPDVENLPELPEGWCWTTVAQIADVIGGVTKGRNLANRAVTTLPYLRVANVQRGFLDLEIMKTIEVPEDEVEKYLLRSGDVLMIEGGDADKLGRAAVWKGEIERCIHQNHIFRVRLIESEMPSLWLVLYANSERGQRYFLESAKQTVNLASINLTQLRSCPIPFPPLIEQAQIVAEVEAKLSNIEQLEITTENNLKRAERERQSILQEAFAGRLVPQDPNDEPASILLERIREERKKREEAEKVLKVGRKGSSMDAAKKRRAKKVAAGEAGLGLYEVLLEAEEPLRPEEVFRLVGLKAEDQPESVEAFYQELRSDVAEGLIGVTPPGASIVLLEALDGSSEEGEALVSMEQVEDVENAEEEELAEPLQGEDEKLSSEWPTLWDELDNA